MPSLSSLLTSPGGLWFAEMFAWTALTVVVVRGLDHALRKRVRPAVRLALYGAVFARLLLPGDWTSPVVSSASDWLASSFPGDLAGSVALANGGAQLIAAPVPALIGSSAAAIATPMAAAATASVVDPWAWLVGLYALVVVLLSARLLLGYRQLARVRRSSSPVTRSIAKLAPRYDIVEHDSQGPLATGVLTPTIILPRRLSRHLPADALANVIRHEVAHHERRDPLLIAALNVVTIALWPVLPLWWAKSRIRDLVEQAADDHALRDSTPAQRQRYAKLLIEMVDLGAMIRPAAPALSLGGYAHLRGRILSLRHRSRWPRWLQAGAVGSAVAGVVACSGLADEDDAGTNDDAVEQGEAELRDGDVAPPETLRVAMENHDRYERSKDPADAETAERAYATFLTQHPDHEKAHEAAYYRAELAWARAVQRYEADKSSEGAQAFAAARTRFMEVLDRHPNSKFREDSLYAQMLAQKNAVEYDEQLPSGDQAPDSPCESQKDATGHPTFPPCPYSDDIRQVVDALDLYLDQTERRDEETVRALYQRAKIAMEHNHFDEAEPALRRLLDIDDSSQFAVWASEMLTDLLTIRWVTPPHITEGAAEQLRMFAEATKSRPLFQHEKADQLREAVPRLLAGIEWKNAQAMLEAGDHLGCAQAFEAMLERYPGHDEADEIIWNAAQCFEAAGEVDDASRMLERMLDTHVGSEHTKAAKKLLRKLDATRH